jgi:hypothetical protein
MLLALLIDVKATIPDIPNNSTVQDALVLNNTPTPAMGQVNFGYNSGFSMTNTFFNGTATGGRACLYFAYQNSTYYGAGGAKWAYMLKAYDTTSFNWTKSVYFGDSQPDVGHYTPSVSVMPDGHLIYIWGYSSPLYYKISIYSAKTESNITRLISNWTASLFTLSTGILGNVAYSQVYRYNDRLVIFGRTGTSSNGAWAEMTYTNNTHAESFTSAFTNDYSGWTTHGWMYNTNVPPMDATNASIYIDAKGSNKKSGLWYFWHIYNGTIYMNQKIKSVFLNISVSYVNGTAGVDVYTTKSSSNYYLRKEGTITAIGWHSFNVTDRFSDYHHMIGHTPDIVAYDVVLNTTSNTGIHDYVKINGFKLDLVYDGFDIIYKNFVETNHSLLGGDSIYGQEYQQGNYFFFSGTVYQGTTNQETNAYFLYSTDEGITWKTVDGITKTRPILASDCLIFRRSSSQRYRTLGACLDENNHPVVLSWERNATGGMGDDGFLFYAQYSGTLGASGSWTYKKAVNDNGLALMGSMALGMDFNKYYQRPTFWTTCNASNYAMTFYVHKSDNTFTKIYQDTSHHYVFPWVNYMTNNAPIYFNSFTSESWWDTLGKWDSIGTNQSPFIKKGVIYACEFTANYTVPITSMTLYCNTSTVWWQAGLYNVTGTGNNRVWKLMANSTQYKTSSDTPARWINRNIPLSFSKAPLVTAGQRYLIAWRSNSSTGIRYYYSSNTTVGQAFRYNSTWQNGGVFPSQISASDIAGSNGQFLNQAVSVVAYPTFCSVRGAGAPTATISPINGTGDYNGDGIVDIRDAAIVGRWWMQHVPPAPAKVDINGDGIIDISEASIIGVNWQKHA